MHLPVFSHTPYFLSVIVLSFWLLDKTQFTVRYCSFVKRLLSTVSHILPEQSVEESGHKVGQNATGVVDDICSRSLALTSSYFVLPCFLTFPAVCIKLDCPTVCMALCSAFSSADVIFVADIGFNRSVNLCNFRNRAASAELFIRTELWIQWPCKCRFQLSKTWL